MNNLWKPDWTSSFLLIDVSYAAFYKYFALKNWYFLAYPDKKPKPNLNLNPIIEQSNEITETTETNVETDLMDDEIFKTKYKKLFMEQILKIAKKYKIKKSNLVFAFDCRSSNIWRHSYTNTYKATRAEAHRRQGIVNCSFFGIAREVIDEYCNTQQCPKFYNPNAEADDIIAISTDYIKTQYILQSQTSPMILLNSKILILASDNDYIQLCSKPPIKDEPVYQMTPQIYLINMRGDFVKSQYPNSLQALISKILMGDNSDNIPACMINKSLFPMIFSKSVITSSSPSIPVYTKCSKSITEKLLTNPHSYQIILEQFEINRKRFKNHLNNKTIITLDELTDEISFNSVFSKSQLIVDFEAIPFFISNEIQQQIKNAITII